MAITTLLLGGVCFGAGLCAGMFLAEKDYLHTSDVKMVGHEVLEFTKLIARTLDPEPIREEPKTPRVVRNHDGVLVIRY